MSMIRCILFDSNATRLYDARLMSNGLPAQIDPIRLAEEGARLVGRLSTRLMHRLLSQCANKESQVLIDLQFQRAGRGRWEMCGTVSTEVTATCQRCLQPVAVAVATEPRIVFVRSQDEERRLSEDLAAEVVVVTGPVALSELVEDELLLAMPMTPLHAADACESMPAPASLATKTVEEKPNPFAVLSTIKKQRD